MPLFTVEEVRRRGKEHWQKKGYSNAGEALLDIYKRQESAVAKRNRNPNQMSKKELKKRVRAKVRMRPTKTAAQELTDIRRSRASASVEKAQTPPSWWTSYERLLRMYARRFFVEEPAQVSLIRRGSGYYQITLTYSKINVEQIKAHRITMFMAMLNKRTPMHMLTFCECVANTQRFCLVRKPGGTGTPLEQPTVPARAGYDGQKRIVENPISPEFYDGTPIRTRVGEKQKFPQKERKEAARLKIEAFNTLRDALVERIQKVTKETKSAVLDQIVEALMDFKGKLIPKDVMEANALNKHIKKLHWDLHKAYIETATEASDGDGNNDWKLPRYFDKSPRVKVSEKQKVAQKKREGEAARFRQFAAMLERAEMDALPEPLGEGLQHTDREKIRAPEELFEYDKKANIRVKKLARVKG